MDAHLTFAISLLLSLTLWWGSMRATLNGDLDLPASGLRFVLAFLLARTAVGLIGFLINSYHRLSIQTAFNNHQDMEGQQASVAPKRRNSDVNGDPTPIDLLDAKRNELEQSGVLENDVLKEFQTSSNDTLPEP